jgi:hypothetical protein
VAAELQALQAMDSVCSLDWARTEQTLRTRLRDWRALLQGTPEVAGQLLRKLIEGRLVFTPGEDAEGEYYSFEGKGRLMPVLQGIVGLPKPVVSPRGPSPVCCGRRRSRSKVPNAPIASRSGPLQIAAAQSPH